MKITGLDAPHLQISTSIEIPIHIYASKVLGVARKRRALFPDGILSDPAWEILLVLFIAYQTKLVVSVAELVENMDVSPKTTARWLNLLVSRGLAKDPEGEDALDTIAALTSKGAELVTECLRVQASAHGAILVFSEISDLGCKVSSPAIPFSDLDDIGN